MTGEELPYGDVYDLIASKAMEAIRQGKSQDEIAAIVIRTIRDSALPLRDGVDAPRVVLGVIKHWNEPERSVLHIHGLELENGGTGCVELRLRN